MMSSLKSLDHCDVTFQGHVKSDQHDGYDILFIVDGVKKRLPYYCKALRTKEDQICDKLTIGKIGSIQSVADGYYFEIYCDQSLRRAPELDISEFEPDQDFNIVETIGWRNDKHPNGFRTVKGIIPFYDYIAIKPIIKRVQLDLPIEFQEICQEHNLAPEQVLNDFIYSVAANNDTKHSANIPNKWPLLARTFLRSLYGKEGVI